LNRADANMVFARVADDVADRLEAEGLRFYRIGPGIVRFVTSFQTTDADVDEALERIREAL
jgi:threonine aldolase